jgi:hypothetical protein
MKRILLLIASTIGLAVQAAEPLVVHEWGTITSRHASDGTALGRLNRIEQWEVLPPFVHRYEPEATQGNPPEQLGKSPLTPGRPDVNMRLETPVIYFYPPGETGFDQPFDVSVRFRGGILNEFFPPATAGVEVDTQRIAKKMSAGVIQQWDGKLLDNYVLGSLSWKSVRLAAFFSPPETDNSIWLAPRAVGSAGIRAASGETERYLFYRGVAHLDALLQTEKTDAGLVLKAPKHLHWLPGPSMTLARVWVVDIRQGGAAAVHEQKGVLLSKNAPSTVVGTAPAFKESSYSKDHLLNLRASMKEALIDAGLFNDEAEAMLSTWKRGYFETPGLRVFYVVPPEWTDYFLPLTVSLPNRMTRVLVGRIDIVQP